MTAAKKRKYAFLIALPALLPVLYMKGVPFFEGVILPFKEFNITKGFSGSPWVGGANFQNLFGNIPFWAALKNTLIMNAGLCAVLMAASLILGISLAHIRSSRLCLAFCVVFIIPFFIPQVFWDELFFKLFGTMGGYDALIGNKRLLLADGRFLRVLYIAIEAIRWTGIFAALIAFAVRKAPQCGRIAAAVKAAFSILLVGMAFLLVTDFELLHTLVSPLAFPYADTLNLLEFRMGLMNMDIGTASSLWLLQSIFCLVILAALLLFAYRFITNSLYPLSNSDIPAEQTGREGAGTVAVVVSSVYAVFIVFVLLLTVIAVINTDRQVSLSMLLRSGGIYFVLAVIASGIGILLSVTLAYPLTTASSAARKVYAAIFIILLAFGQFGIQDYVLIRSLGMVNTYFAIIAANMFNPAFVLILGLYFNQKSGDTSSSFGRFVITCFPVILCLFVAATLLNADSYTSSLIYMNRPDMLSPTVQFSMALFKPAP